MRHLIKWILNHHNFLNQIFLLHLVFMIGSPYNQISSFSRTDCRRIDCKIRCNHASDVLLFEQMRQPVRPKVIESKRSNDSLDKQVMKGLFGTDNDPKLKANSQFLDWLAENGVWIKTVSAWGRAPHPLVIASETEAEGESCGRGILARESIGEGELLITIPLDICFTKQLARERFGSDIIDDDTDEYIAIALLLMVEKLKGSQSKWKPYFDVLPSIESVNPSFIWTNDELEVLKGSPTYYASLSLRNKILREFRNVHSRKLNFFRSRLPVDQITPDLFLWAFVMLFSRAARLTSKQSGEELAMIPYADLMNHNPFSNTYIDAQKSGMPLFSRKEEVAVYSDRSYRKFEQVFINYGDKGNGDLLLLYGFALDRNPIDSVDISLGLSREDPLFSQKKAYLERSGRELSAARFPLQKDRYPSEMVDFLRLLLAEPTDLGMQSLEKMNFNEPISPSLERRVLTSIVDICRSYLQRYPSSLEEDEALMMDRGLFQKFSRQQRMAIKLRVAEKKILIQTIRAVEEEIDKLPKALSEYSSNQDITPAGRSFDPLKSRTGKTRKPKALQEMVEIKESSQREKKFPVSFSIADKRRKRRGNIHENEREDSL